jgi:hypothetical protein
MQRMLLLLRYESLVVLVPVVNELHVPCNINEVKAAKILPSAPRNEGNPLS